MIEKRAKAFTIMEVTIAMFISAIVIGITYTIYSIISHSYNSFNGKNETMAIIVRLDELLQKDFDKADLILKDTAGIAFQKANNIIKYKFDADHVIRIGLIADTFEVKVDSANTFFETKSIDAISPSNELNCLDGLDLLISTQNEKIMYHYHKQYSSENLFKRNPNALH
ncbi:MAG TPA: prepilin-type N-terminal cleavage/methylation domain-containing protein [Mucilaginibacter sp.]|nr:prepilin-type N-terminal cleavage/methylation domain-containing protein [Mucilaginibacter sp.]